MTNPTLRIALADDHQMFLDGLHSLLNQIEGVQVVATANHGQQLLRKLEAIPRVHVAVLDRHMPVMDGIQTTRALRAHHPHMRVLGVTMDNDLDTIKAMLDAGASGYILKNTDKTELAIAIEKVAAGEFYLSQEVNAQLAQEFLHHRQQKNALEEKTSAALTEREKEILILLAQEMNHQEIADRLFISSKTVETHRKNLMKKICVRNMLGIYKYALAHKLI